MAKPLTRKEQILAGEDIKPLTREEIFLQEHVKESTGGGGGSEPFVVTITFSRDHSAYAKDKTFEEIKDALESGRVVIGKYSDNTIIRAVSLYDDYIVFFQAVPPAKSSSGTRVEFRFYFIKSDETVDFYDKEI